MTDNTERAQVGWGFWLWWVLASTVGIIVSLIVGLILSAASSNLLETAMLFAATGASVGIAQWLVLRKRVSRAGWWVLASTVGFAVVAPGALDALETFGIGILGGGSSSPGYAGFVLGLALYGAITGGVMVWLLWDPDIVTEKPSIPEYFP